MGFTSLGLSAPILKAVEAQGYSTPSPIQLQAIPAVIEGKDVMAAAQTGTGKTAGFTLPLLERLSNGPKRKFNQVRALVLTPTRELAAQVHESVEKYSVNLPLTSDVVFGGVKANPQMQRLRKGVDVLVATPGRLLDLANQNAIKFDQLEILVLDEADRMLDMGFIHDIKKILNKLPKNRQNLLFSATFSDEIRQLAKGLVNNPVEISVAQRNTTAETVEQSVYVVDKTKKARVLTKLIKDNDWKQVLVFSKTKHGANRLAKTLEEKGVSAAAIHGNKSQGARTKALANFKSGQVRVLVATDIAARGLDIEQLPQVINVDLPKVPEDYVHRIGRTGRAGATGKAVSFVSEDESKELFAIERLIQKVLPRHTLEGFEPTLKVPESKLDTRPIKAKKPKKAKAPRVDHKDGQRSGENRNGHKQGAKPSQRRNTEHSAGGAKKEGGNNKKRPVEGGKPKTKGNGENRGNGSNFGGGKPKAAGKPKTGGSSATSNTKPRRQGPRPARKPQAQS
ncbi:DEAD/DEAH box helicase [Aliivibrio sp. S4TY2]|uniref:DEAD/DEAH box helicase n=1 Tax=unclassified Aliivibrio TaxID=2645654 RepID=UPI0023788239|nr:MULTISPECIES: DEAD/DEAH box helicase [unclassified Aliivibrio]MDD9155335.1 DEAD/DEAH box helicase [Aliivibrio sp. S4TY2]MDD9159113.1 DEAD/DEAH box helicase [Aliivibrio sp. S4TY1]MDD9163337.1 DEAD/DEAH box helicase [Aliivibrio sp. S4MY2]MDD9167112.1 DEAD/DEAH box helicase [Aliivibrio sp. S4MY4]MDD9184414.1 DEAD/DEAH box helicase [Aliivibrio sp. S4MY3]